MQPRLVLIADDHEEFPRDLGELLEIELPFNTVAAKNGSEALALASRRLPDVALLDINMPRMNGLETARRIRRRLGERRPLLIAMTGRADVAAVASSGLFDHVLRKPLEIDELVR
jgi:CheY-like chemotaxis protein